MLIGGWRLAGTYNIQSGVPVVFGTNSFFTGNDVALPHDKQSLNEWFDTAQFAAFPSKTTKPATGNSIKNGVYQDFGKTLRLTEQTHLELRIDAFNALNHPRFGAPNTDPGSANFGRVTPAQENQSRSVELAGKLFF